MACNSIVTYRLYPCGGAGARSAARARIDRASLPIYAGAKGHRQSGQCGRRGSQSLVRRFDGAKEGILAHNIQ